ncbi:hypothetical protein Kpho02_73100 [Kitasatospora phosalacinea]|uniref:Uncharacterized protein n=1 Tax=Kitasatospora phosalacinea TaxID=2065 RepID=A0A9W6QHF8_9ACTN|nr:hypothetical protein Kpho02_73100 [Kitasatospora phosalacinea]
MERDEAAAGEPGAADGARRCRVCGEAIRAGGAGQRPEYCSRSCSSKAYRGRVKERQEAAVAEAVDAAHRAAGADALLGAVPEQEQPGGEPLPRDAGEAGREDGPERRVLRETAAAARERAGCRAAVAAVEDVLDGYRAAERAAQDALAWCLAQAMELGLDAGDVLAALDGSDPAPEQESWVAVPVRLPGRPMRLEDVTLDPAREPGRPSAWFKAPRTRGPDDLKF